MKFHHWALSETPSSRDSIRMADGVYQLYWTHHFFFFFLILSSNCQVEGNILIAHYFEITIVIIERLDKVVNVTLKSRLKFHYQNSQRPIVPS